MRVAVVLAGVLIKTGQVERPRSLLLPLYGRFTEGFGTPDLLAASAVLRQLGVRAGS